MTPEERQLLADLFERIRGTASAPRDREAEAMIADAVRAQPYAPYFLAQTVLVQEEALKAAASRIQELESQLASRRPEDEGAGGFLGGLGKSIFGGSSAPARPTSVPRAGSPWNQPQAAPPPPAPPTPQGGPWGPAPGGYAGGGPGFGAPGFGAAPGGGGGGFLRGALTTAAGVAGGALLFQGISNLLGSAHAASPLAQSMVDPASATAGVNDIFNSMPGEQGSRAEDVAAARDTGNDAGYDDAGYGDDDTAGGQDAGYDDGGSDDGGDGGGDGGDWV